MIKNYFKVAWRNLLKNKVYSFINIFGLAIGMAVTIMITLWVTDELSFNNYFEKHERIAQIYQSQTFNGNVGTGQAIPRPLEMLMRNEYGDNFNHIAMSSWTNSSYIKYGETNISRSGNYIQPEGLKIFTPKIVKGTANGLDEQNSIMLSASAAKAIFGEEEGEGPQGLPRRRTGLPPGRRRRGEAQRPG